MVKFKIVGKNVFWPRPFWTVGKFGQKYKNPILAQYRHYGTLNRGFMIRRIECKYPFYDLTFMEAHFSHALFGLWENLAKNAKILYRLNIGIMVHYIGFV